MAPNIPVRDENGEYSLSDGLGGEVINPLAQMANTYDRTKVMKLNGFGGLSYDFLESVISIGKGIFKTYGSSRIF